MEKLEPIWYFWKPEHSDVALQQDRFTQVKVGTLFEAMNDMVANVQKGNTKFYLDFEWLLGNPQFLFVIYFNLTNNHRFWRNVLTTMYGQALFIFECFMAIIALKSLLLVVG